MVFLFLNLFFTTANTFQNSYHWEVFIVKYKPLSPNGAVLKGYFEFSP